MKYIGIFAITSLLFSCSNTNTLDTVSTVIAVDVDARSPVAASEYFTRTDIVELESGDESVIAGISKIMFTDEFLAVADRRGNQICLFDYDGHHIRTIRRAGRGPQEYISMSAVAIDADNRRFVVYDSMTDKIKFYSFEGEWGGERACEPLVSDMTVSDGTLYMTLYDTYTNRTDYVAMMPLDETGGVTVIYPFTAPLKTDTGLAGTTVSNCAPHVLLSQRFDNNIYEIVGGEVTPKYTMDFGAYDCTAIVDGMDGEPLAEALREGDCVYGITDMMETDRYLFFKTNVPGTVIYDKQAGRAAYCAAIRVEGVPISTSATAVVDNADDKIVSILKADHVLSASEYLARRGETEPKIEIREDFRRIMDGITEDSNPVIMIHHLK